MKGIETIVRLRKKYAILRGVETFLLSAGIGLLLWALLFLVTHRNDIAIPVALVLVATVAAIRGKHLGLFSLSDERIAFFLDREFYELKDSSDLMLRPQSSLSGLEQIQANRTSDALTRLMKVKLPHRLPTAAVVLVIGVAGALLVFNIPQEPPSLPEQQLPASVAPVSEPAPASIATQQLNIQPPAYTGIKQATTKNLTARVPEGSKVTWEIEFTEGVDRAWISFADGDSMSLAVTDTKAVGEKRLVESTIYLIGWSSSNSLYSSDYFEITVKPDEPPSVQIRNIEQFTRLKWGERTFMEVPVILHDDFGLTQGHIVATVSKGSGESIKFREEKLPFDSPSKIGGNDISASRRINFVALGMDPGDEVYFYAEAWDNKTPNPQRNRTETYFVSLQDTASQVVTVDASLGVDLMPDYFRSQRQIIIDTEKLLKDQPKISKQAFNSTSNELGYDQKVLRLKYGQFLGEEFETTIGEPADEAEAEDEEEEQDPTKKYSHQHDKDNEHNLVVGKKPEVGHEHGTEGEEEDITQAYKHEHDNMEEATFFTISVRSKLKAALSLMWEAELQLRLFAPKESLPIQYKILNLLREISQDSRIYVHRMGFDPPPLKEDRRLTGDLEEIGNPKGTTISEDEAKYPAIRAALPAIQRALQQNPIAINDDLKSLLENAAREIAAESIERHGDYLIQLSQIRSIIDGTMSAEEIEHALEDIQSVCWNILPPTQVGPNQVEGTRHALDARLLEELKRPANE